MSQDRDKDLVRELCSQPAELDWLEFKQSNINPDKVGVYCSALSNSARLAGKDFGYIVWGIDNDNHKIVGTSFNPNVDKANGQIYAFWLAQLLKPSIPFNFRIVEFPEGRVVYLEIPAATSAPVTFRNIPYIRIGSATPRLTDYPDRYQQLNERLRPYSWEHALAKQYITRGEVLELLDFRSYFRLTKQSMPETLEGILEKLEAETFIKADIGNKWGITNLGAILFAGDLGEFDTHIARKSVRFVAYSGNNRAANVTHRVDGRKGYAIGFEGILDYLNSLLPKNELIGSALRTEQPLFPSLAIRELIANALIHQDMTISGSGPQIELFKDRIEITNPGRPLMPTNRMIDLPPRSRNESLASIMRRMGMCEEQGSGLDKVIREVELFQLPPPLLRDDGGSMQVVLYGPRTFAEMTPDERIRACYHHSVLKFLSGDRMKNASLCERFGIDTKNASQASVVIRKALDAGLIVPADAEHPRAGYVPWWA